MLETDVSVYFKGSSLQKSKCTQADSCPPELDPSLVVQRHPSPGRQYYWQPDGDGAEDEGLADLAHRNSGTS